MIVTDRTIPELIEHASSISRLDMINFCFHLKNAGVDLLEITREAADKMVRLPKSLTFLFRVKGWADLAYAADHHIQHIVVDADLLTDTALLEEATRRNLSITAEVTQGTRSLRELLADRLPQARSASIDILRIVGLERMITGHWVRQLREQQEQHALQFDICATNQWHNAVGTVLDAAISGIGCCTTSFAGLGNPGYAPTEEVLLALAVAFNRKPAEGVTQMPDMKRQFERFLRKRLPDNKPVLGESLFRVESGIHADGIGKNPETYEPYPPEWVGQERQLVIGKHSGRKAILDKMAQLQVSCNASVEDLLHRCRNRSVELGHSLSDTEFVRLVKSMPGGTGVRPDQRRLIEAGHL